MSLISPDHHFALLAILFGLAAFGFWVEHTRIGQTLSGVILVILAGLVLSNLGLLPFGAPLYDLVWSYGVPMAIPLLLFKADLRRILPTTGPMLISFVIAVIGTIAGVFVGGWAIDLGSAGPQITSILGASWIGGSMNFAAVSRALEVQDASLLSAMAAADNVGGTLFLILLVALPSLKAVRRFLPSAIMDQVHLSDPELELEEDAAPLLNMGHLALLLFLSALCCFLGFGLAELLGVGSFGVLFVTLFALAIANFFATQMQELHGDFPLGMLFMYVFFAVMGAGADIRLMIDTALPIFAFTGVMAAVHLAIVLSAAKLLRLDLAEVLLASNAVALGPATAAAMAAGQGWRTLVTPAVMLGVLGYAIANFIGVGLEAYLR